MFLWQTCFVCIITFSLLNLKPKLVCYISHCKIIQERYIIFIFCSKTIFIYFSFEYSLINDFCSADKSNFFYFHIVFSLLIYVFLLVKFVQFHMAKG